MIKIVGAICGTEIQHYQTWTDKIANAPALTDKDGNIVFPQLPAAPDLPNPPDGTDNAGPNDTNQIFAAPCEFIAHHLPPCSVIRPISTQQGGAVATIAFFKADGLFIGQSQVFLDLLNELAAEAEAEQAQEPECDTEANLDEDEFTHVSAIHKFVPSG